MVQAEGVAVERVSMAHVGGRICRSTETTWTGLEMAACESQYHLTEALHP